MTITLDSSFPVALVTSRGQSLAIKSVLVHYLHFSKLELLDKESFLPVPVEYYTDINTLHFLLKLGR